MVKHNLTEVAIFNQDKVSIHASEFLYRKDVMVVRGHFRPPTLVTQDAFEKSFEQFKNEEGHDPESARLVAEITMDNLLRFGPLDEKDYLDRTEMLCALGLIVIISDCSNHQKLINYLSDYKINRLGIVIGVYELQALIKEKYENNKDGRLLTAFGELFSRNISVYAYPALEREDDKLVNVKDLPVPDEISFLYQHLLNNRQIIQVENPDKKLLNIIPYKVFEDIGNGKDGSWESCMPDVLPPLIKANKSFGYGRDEDPFEYDKTDGRDAEYYS